MQGEIGIQMVPFKEMAYVQDRGQYVPQDEVRPGETLLSLSGTEFRRRLREGIDIPAWFSYPEVVEELRRRYPPSTARASRCCSPDFRAPASRRSPMP